MSDDTKSQNTNFEPVKLNPMAAQVAEQYKNNTYSPVMFCGLVRIAEFTAVTLAGIGCFLFYVGFNSKVWLYYPFVSLFGAALYLIFMEINDGFQLSALRSPLKQISRIFIAWVSAFTVLTAAAFLLKVSADFSRFWFLLWFVSGFSLLIIMRAVTAYKIRSWVRDGTMERRAVIVGGGANAETLIRSLEAQPENDIRICGIFDDRDNRRSPPIVAGYPKLGNISELVEFARIAHIDMLIVSIPISAEERVLSLLKKLWVLPVDIRLSAHNSHLRFRPRAYSYIGNLPMLDMFDKPITDWDSVAKRIFDIIFSLIGIIVFSPIMLLTALAIKLDSRGPVFFKQKRHGFNNEVIEVLKFRSMYHEQSDFTAKVTVSRNDPRVTRVGRFIRKASIDELPQFFNALMGSLSLVGPRPHAVSAVSHNLLYNEVVDGYFARHRVKPGVTGWAQINGWRGEIDNAEKIRMRTEFDLYYIENWSLWFDLKILFLTPIRLLNTENAY